MYWVSAATAHEEAVVADAVESWVVALESQPAATMAVVEGEIS